MVVLLKTRMIVQLLLALSYLFFMQHTNEKVEVAFVLVLFLSLRSTSTDDNT
jgi:hypothetical protein